MQSLAFAVAGSAIAAGAAIAIVALGELLAEKTGVLNLGLEGTMLMGAVIAFVVVNRFVQNAFAGLAAAILVGALMGGVFALSVVVLKANQPLCGLAMNFVGAGLSGLIGAPYAAQPTAARFQPIRIPVLGHLPLIGDTFFNQTVLVYFAYLVLPAFIYWLLHRTRHGLSIQAAGEDPAAADAAGIHVDRLRFLYATVGGALAGVGGAYVTLAHTPAWTEGVTAGRGWIALALVIFAGWRPFGAVAGALVFGAVTSVGFIGQLRGWPLPSAYLSMLPYLGTLGLMFLPFLLKSRVQRRLKTEPSALGVPYSREEAGG
jgi:ABC-type uncharacterized transport system permease subunit